MSKHFVRIETYEKIKSRTCKHDHKLRNTNHCKHFDEIWIKNCEIWIIQTFRQNLNMKHESENCKQTFRSKSHDKLSFQFNENWYELILRKFHNKLSKSKTEIVFLKIDNRKRFRTNKKLHDFFSLYKTQRRYNFKRYLNDWRLMRKFDCRKTCLTQWKYHRSKFWRNFSKINQICNQCAKEFAILLKHNSKTMKQTRTQKRQNNKIFKIWIHRKVIFKRRFVFWES